MGQNCIGIDCGATTCRAALRRGERVLHVTGSGGNAFTAPDAAAAAINACLDSLADRARMTRDDIAGIPAHVAVAGVIDQGRAAILARALPLRNAVTEDERRAALRGALGTRDGAVLAVGTGSFVAIQRAGVMRAAGGYGLALGDEASGAWLGREALAATARALDGLGPASPLTDRFAAVLGGMPGVIERSVGLGPARLARYARIIGSAARNDDAVAWSILAAGADYLAHALDALGWRAPLPVVLTGGVSGLYSTVLRSDITAALTDAAGSTLDGALALAGEMT